MVITLEEATEFFAVLYDGAHHIPGGVKGLKEFGAGWSVNHIGDLSTFDFNVLTRLVFLAHDCCYRAEIMQGGPHAVKIAIWKRERDGSMSKRHPTIESALAVWRERHPFK